MFGQECQHVPELLPYGIYSIPEISMVGATEESAARDLVQETRATLGVHVIGTGATELIHIGQAAIAFGAPVDYFVDTVFNYPTLAECYKVAALNGLNRLNNI